MADLPSLNPFDENDQSQASHSADMRELDSDSGGRSLAWLILGVAAIGCALFFAAALFFFRADVQSVYNQYFPSPTATPSQTPSATATPSVTPTPNMTATQRVVQVTATAQAIESLVADAGSQWDVLLTDSFDSVGDNWATGTDDDEYATIVRQGVDGAYQWEATSKRGFISWITAGEEIVTDFHVSVEAERLDGSASSDFGLVFRDDEDNNFYYFGVSDDGYFVLLNFENEWLDIVEFTSSSVIAPGARNRITVIARGSYFIFLINDVVVAEVEDDRIPSGTTALAMQIYEEGLDTTIAFDNFELRVP